MLHLLIAVVIVAIVAYAAAVLALWRVQERIVFQPPRGAPPEPVAARQVRFRTVDGLELFGYLVGDATKAETVVIAFHGNAELARWRVPWAQRVVDELDACVFIPEFRGYDGAPGTPSYVGSQRDADAALAVVRETLGAPLDRIVYFGHSLGTAIAAELAARQPPRALALQAPLSSARAMSARMLVPGLPLWWRVVSRVHFDTVARVQSLDVPVSVAHGDRDMVVPQRMGREVFAAAKRKGTLLLVPGAAHGNIPEVASDAYWSWLRDAVRAAPADLTTRDAPAATRSAP